MHFFKLTYNGRSRRTLTMFTLYVGLLLVTLSNFAGQRIDPTNALKSHAVSGSSEISKPAFLSTQANNSNPHLIATHRTSSNRTVGFLVGGKEENISEEERNLEYHLIASAWLNKSLFDSANTGSGFSYLLSPSIRNPILTLLSTVILLH